MTDEEMADRLLKALADQAREDLVQAQRSYCARPLPAARAKMPNPSTLSHNSFLELALGHEASVVQAEPTAGITIELAQRRRIVELLAQRGALVVLE